MKKVLISLLCLSLMFCLFAVNVNAEDDLVFEVNTKTANRGDEIEVEVLVTKNPGITGIEFSINYNDAVLQLNGVVCGDVFGEKELTTPDTYKDGSKFIFENGLEDLAGTGVLIKFKFTVNEGADFGDTDVKFNVGDAYNIDFDTPVFAPSTTGKVTVNCPHTNAAKVEAKDSDCVTAGNIEYYKCPDCNKYFSDEACATDITEEDTVVAALGHKTIAHPAVAPTCTEAGTLAYWECSVCKKLYSDEACTTETTLEATVDPVIPHTTGNYESNETGHWKVCSMCNQEIDKVEHTPGQPESHTDATCTEPERNGAVKCTVCNYVISEGEILSDPLGHNTNHYEFKDSTCTELGNKQYWECTVCGKCYTEAECTNEIAKEDTVIEMKEHTYGELIPIDEADHHKSGKAAHYICSVCNKIFDSSKNETTEEALNIPQQPHDTFTAWTTDDNNHWHQCSCGDKFDEAAHEREERDHVDPTCTEDGSDGGIYCKVCNKKLVDGGNVIPALGHNMAKVAEVLPTCTTPGNVHYWHCDRCNLNFKDAEGNEVINNVVTAALGHIFEEGKCKRCGADDPNYQKTPYIVPIDNDYHGVFNTPGVMTYQRHYPSIFGPQNDGVNQWHICGACGTVFDVKPLANTGNPDDVTVTEPGDSDEIIITEPIEPGDTDEEPDDADVVEPSPAPVQEDTNPKTGIVLSLTALSCAALAVVIGKRR